MRTIFRRFIELGSILKVVREGASAAGPARPGPLGRHPRPGRPHGASTIHAILHNRIYLGESKHRDQYVPDTHLPIIDRLLWDDAQALLQVTATSAAMPAAPSWTSCSGAGGGQRTAGR